MKSKKSTKSIQDFDAKQFSEKQLHAVKGGQGTFIVEETAEGI